MAELPSATKFSHAKLGKWWNFRWSIASRKLVKPTFGSCTKKNNFFRQISMPPKLSALIHERCNGVHRGLWYFQALLFSTSFWRWNFTAQSVSQLLNNSYLRQSATASLPRLLCRQRPDSVLRPCIVVKTDASSFNETSTFNEDAVEIPRSFLFWRQ